MTASTQDGHIQRQLEGTHLVLAADGFQNLAGDFLASQGTRMAGLERS